MAEGSHRKLVVEISQARNLMPKDGQGTSSPYVQVDFDGQRRRTKTKFRELNPQWDEKLEFLVNDPESMASETLELNIYNDKKTGKRSTFLGKVKLSGNSFPKIGSESFTYFPLEKRSVFSQIKGELGLKVYYIDEEPPEKAPAPSNPEEKPPENAPEPAKEEEKPQEKAKTEEAPPAKEEEKPPENKDPSEKPAPEAEDSKKEEEKPHEKPPEKSPENASQKVLATTKTVSGVNTLQTRIIGDGVRGAYDLVERMPYLYVRVVKAKRTADNGSTPCLYAKLGIGTQSVSTRTVQNTEWDQVFAFQKEKLNSASLEVSVHEEKKPDAAADTPKDTPPATDTCLGTVSFDLQEIPKRVPPDSPLAPQWYTLEGGLPEGDVALPGNDVMLAVWYGTQADEAFPAAWQSDSGGLLVHTRAKVYLAPKLWYLRLTVIQTQDLQFPSTPEPKARAPELYVRAQLGPQVLKTVKSVGLSANAPNPSWNEDLIFIAAEPFEPFLVVGVEDQPSGQQVGKAKIHVASLDRRIDEREEPKSKWYNLGSDENKAYAGRIHVRACLEGGYHVLDEPPHLVSDSRASAKQLWKPPIGSLELGILGATNLMPIKTMDGTRGTTDAYCVAKYGTKWVRTRTVLDNFSPRWNEQYTWEVYDPSTVLTLGVFDNAQYGKDEGKGASKDTRIGKVRIRLSTLDTNRVYTNSYTLTVLQPGGTKKMGELELAVRFSCTSYPALMASYFTPPLPRMHYARPLPLADALRHAAARTLAVRLSRSEPPLRPEVVHYLLDSDANSWSMRRTKAHWFRLASSLSKLAALAHWLDSVRYWSQPYTTILVHVLFVILILFPNLFLPTFFLYLFFIGVWRYRYRRNLPENIDIRLSCVDLVSLDELDEEFEGFPANRAAEVVRVRYDRLRAVAGRAQTLLGEAAGFGERLEALLDWRDPRATLMFVVACLGVSGVLYAIPSKVVAIGLGLYFFRHPRFRGDSPPAVLNFFQRFPSLADRIL
ncbi:protein QUIRKY [Amborella trichopoda]|uniref:C2 domain-containing protein n=1 Tax=Amborella trichopoda TaxID=13333 RepID=W1NDX5_AMBTC|nr:protein QUIRKY [Amborella trichopoda]XP_020517492.1 protein QUIRKY [Amborella trichopoda]XP_020517499.1 protein QUIRKY [Amborella trichopoda]XP_020517504.1 protein QUIRKY [Amborella trichopoda]XP_020517507.1 protein QUIRKY [Amborella trichopoda]ERM93558.1 hypothetical protein AMTR_s00004p00091660 [Amborella trichopoda]|eukprot:XP_006826321.1 protein QUIRKY [Amborella trichopoda]